MSLADRAKNIILSPKTEWPVIDTEQTTVSELYSRYIIPLVLIGPVAGFIGSMVFGLHIPLVGTYRPTIGTAIGSAVTRFVLGLIGVYVLAVIIDMLAPSFDGQRNQIQALKVAAYSSTASWVAGVFGIFPLLAWLAILGLWSLYLLYTGLPVLMKSPPEKSMGYTIVIIIAAIILAVIIGVIARSLFGAGAMMSGI
ncbi:MAG: Yip1 family protein [Gemmatimonadaceae bacterium]